MSAKHTQGELCASTMQMDADDWALLNDGSSLDILQQGQDVIAVVWAGDGADDAANAARLALCWNMHDEMADALRDLMGLIDLLLARQDTLGDLRTAIANNHRLVSSLAVLAKLDGAK